MTTLASFALSILASIGRWVLSRLAEHGRGWLLRYMAGKIAKFEKRAQAAGWRGAWNEARAARWTAAREWVRSNWLALRKRGAAALDKALEDRLPYHVPCEEWECWATSREGQLVRTALGRQGVVVV